MSKIKMFDMGFGDAHLLERKDYNEKLLVDFGSYNSKVAKVASVSIPKIKSEISKEYNVSFLLTHFHWDHYNQLSNLPDNLFDNIYLRNVYDSEVTVYRSIYELMYFAKKGRRWENALNTILAIPNLLRLLKPSGEFVFVRKGSSFVLNNETYEVYRPDINIEAFQPIIFEENNVNGFIKDMLSSIDAMRNYILDIGIQMEGGTFTLSNERLRNSEIQVNEISNWIKGIAEGFNFELSFTTKRKLSDFIRSTDEHKFNIIFGLKNKNEFRLLMCGDAESKDVENVVSENAITKINVLKAPHHGTPSHFPKLSNVEIVNVLIPYSYPIYPCKGYSIDGRYFKAPYDNSFIPPKDFDY